jgi:hypothetical protein
VAAPDVVPGVGAVGEVQVKASHVAALWQITNATCSAWQFPHSGQAASTPHAYDCTSWHVVTVSEFSYARTQSLHAIRSPLLVVHACRAAVSDWQVPVGVVGLETGALTGESGLATGPNVISPKDGAAVGSAAGHVMGSHELPWFLQLFRARNSGSQLPHSGQDSIAEQASCSPLAQLTVKSGK